MGATNGPHVGSQRSWAWRTNLDTVGDHEAHHVIAIFGIIDAFWGCRLVPGWSAARRTGRYLPV